MCDSFCFDFWIGVLDELLLVVYGLEDCLILADYGVVFVVLVLELSEFVEINGVDYVMLVRDGFYDEVWFFLV